MYLQLPGINLFYEKIGHGPILLFLHGNGEDHSIFHELVDQLKSNYTCYLIDSRNHGKSSQTDDFGYDSMTKDTQLFIQKLKLQKVTVIGFSDGAIIAILLALKQITNLKKLILLGPNLTPSDFNSVEYEQLVVEYETSKDPLIKLMLNEPNIKPVSLNKITLPTLIIAGEHDVFTPESFKQIQKNIFKSELVILPKQTHDSYIIHQAMLAKQIHDFMKK